MKCVVARLAAAAALLCLAVIPARAQSGTSSLTGRVTDPQQAVLPGATVTLTNTATGTSRTSVTNESGLYAFSALPPGLYTLKVELSGFRTAEVDKLELRVDMQSRGDVQMAAPLFGASQALREVAGVSRTPFPDAGYDGIMPALRSKLDEPTLAPHADRDQPAAGDGVQPLPAGALPG